MFTICSDPRACESDGFRPEFSQDEAFWIVPNATMVSFCIPPVSEVDRPLAWDRCQQRFTSEIVGGFEGRHIAQNV